MGLLHSLLLLLHILLFSSASVFSLFTMENTEKLKSTPLYEICKSWAQMFGAGVSKLYDHGTMRGSALELLVQNFLKATLGGGVIVGPAVLIGADGKASKRQLDLVIYRTNSPALFPPGSSVPFVLGSAVVAVVEVKSGYSKNNKEGTAATACEDVKKRKSSPLGVKCSRRKKNDVG
jgi:DNA-binding XRE family transcriptional regulator